MTKPPHPYRARAICMAVLGGLVATAAWAGSKKKAKPAEDAQAAEDSGGADKSRFEAYLKDRLSKIQDAHKMRMDFFDKEKTSWDNFWTRIRDERRKFEIRITRQTLDLFESLASLDPKDHAATVSNFEKLQNDLIKSFEQQQKQKMQEFFSDRESRWKEFAGEQEKERSEFVADAEAGWKENKASIRESGGRAPARSSAKPRKSSKPSAKAAPKAEEETSEDAPEEDAPPPPKKKSSSKSSEDVWH
ncbi:MAG: hypothetical protein HY077_17095 [Elusimicrobia bacterium]|nr:hypothetical protein [Elusimicrobiota bacterium]